MLCHAVNHAVHTRGGARFFCDNMNRFFLPLVLMLSVAGCASLTDKMPAAEAVAKQSTSQQDVTPFSANGTGSLPSAWEPLIILRTKKPTHYQLVIEKGKTVLHAYADEASSGLMHHVSIDPLAKPWLNWQWKVGSIVETVDYSKHTTEDSPARLILGFDGDKDKLSFSDQILFETAKVFTGYDFPYATLMYIWDKSAPIGSVMTSHRTGRIKMIVVANGDHGVGQWQTFTRNIAEDFEKAYGEKPGKLIGVGVLTDTDNLEETVEAWYGDIRLQRGRK
jgi:hypothetical protein